MAKINPLPPKFEDSGNCDVGNENSDLFDDLSDTSDNDSFLDECVAQTPAYLRYMLSQTSSSDNFTACSKSVFGFVLLADISGFTRLSSVLEVESLKYHINHFFTRLLDTVEEYNGDAVKLCGDAILIIWTTSSSSSRSVKEERGMQACQCGIELLNRCGNYQDFSGPSPVSLKLHCGMSAGELHCMCLGNNDRMEFLISGAQLKDMGLAESEASAGEFCISAFAYSFIEKSVPFVATSMGNYLYGGEATATQTNTESLLGRFSSFHMNGSLSRNQSVMGSAGGTGTANSALGAFLSSVSPGRKPSAGTVSRKGQTEKSNGSVDGLSGWHSQDRSSIPKTNQQPGIGTGKRGLAKFKAIALATKSSVSLKKVARRRKDLVVRSLPSLQDTSLTGGRKELMRFVHQSSRSSVLGGTGDFLAEIRHVVTIFVQILNLDNEFDNGDLDRPQLVIITILELLAKLGGALRQYVVDDKGCVVICSFGVPGFSHKDNEARAVLSGLGIMDALSEHGVICRIGISSGNAYCGYCGSEKRKEYVILGPSVNLAARLMGKAAEQQILISDSVYDCVVRDFEFQILDPVNAKGYDRPVRVYSPQRDISSTDMDTMLSKTVYSRKKLPLIGRRAEVYSLRAHVHSSLHANSDLVETPDCISVESTTNNKLLIEAPQGFGKTTLVKYIVDIEDALLRNTPVICCHLASMGDSYETVLHILRELFHVDTNSSAHTSDSIMSFTDDCNDKLVEVLSLHSKTSYADVWFVLKQKPKCPDTVKFAWRQRNNNLSMSCPQIEEVDPYECDTVRCTEKPACDENVIDSKHISAIIPLILSIGTLPESESEMITKSENELYLTALLEFVLSETVNTSSSRTLIIEDLQWCDKDSYRVLLRMMKRIKSGCFIGTMRPKESTRRMSYMRADSIVDSGHVVSINDLKKLCNVILLKHFSARDIRVAIETILGPKLISEAPNAVSEGSILNILRNSDNGVPGSVVKLVHDLRSTIGKSQDSDGGGINKVAQAAVDGLSAESQVVLKVAAICGTKFCVDLVDEVLQNMDFFSIADNLLIHMSELTSRRLVRKTYGVVPYLNSSASGNRSNSTATYTFSDKCIREYVCLLMLDSQKKSIHSCIARAIEEHYLRWPSKFSDHVITYLAFHFAHTDDRTKEILYAEKAAHQTGSNNLLADSYEYYEHLVGIATGCASVADVLKQYYHSPNKRRCSLSLHNYAQFESVFVTKRYLVASEMKGHIRIQCQAISRYLLMIYLSELSLLEFRRRRFAMSNNLFLLARHIGGPGINYVPWSIGCSRRNIAEHHTKTFAALYCAQAEVCLMRGDITSASAYIAHAVLLLKKRKNSEYIAALALQSTIQMCNGNITASSKSMTDAITLCEDSSVIEAVAKAKFHYHSAFKSASVADFDAARVDLYCGHMCQIEDSRLLQFELWNSRAWVDFLGGDVASAEVLMSDNAAALSNRGSGTALYKVWCLELKIVINTLGCKFSLAKNNLTLLENTQQGHYGEMYRHALNGILAVFTKHFLSPDIALRRKCSTLLVFSAHKFSQRNDVSPIGIVCTFMTAFSCLAILANDVYLHFDRGGGLAHRMRQHTAALLVKLEQFSVGIPCLIVLKETLLMKMVRLNNRVNTWGECVTSCGTKLPLSFFRMEMAEYSISKYSQFTFGRAFWCAEMYACRQVFNSDCISNDHYRVVALEMLRKYDMSPDHPIFD